ncbi:hypothetical protein KHA94_08725 [Bacillus sp. FJAT-49705]|uniref:Uncharacterized protein n=1 Tax=Cytobacillus citreus TaxID=2833586 RepID=A0ABS5NR39_9BACI|nr:hypothetical protein [Cytobacillus citreus]MBS4190286.1 hypothetical protein [Cytobacillus citreus]
MNTILTQEPEFAESDVFRGLKQYDRKANVYVRQLLFYPYYFFEFELSAKSLLKLSGKIACTIDGISGKEAIIDMKPAFSTCFNETADKLSVQVEEMEARKIAERFVFQTISQKTKFISIPSLKISDCSLFYRPFWLAEYILKEKGKQQLIVDAISGSYHPL